MTSNASSFRQHANSMQNAPESPDSWNTKGPSTLEVVEAHRALAPPSSTLATSSTDDDYPKPLPKHLPRRIPQQSLWTRSGRDNKCSVTMGISRFLIIVGGAVAGAFFLTNVVRTGMFHAGADAGLRNSTQTVHVTATTVVPGLGKEMEPVTETVWSMQETNVLTQWVVVIPKTTTVPVMPTKHAS